MTLRVLVIVHILAAYGYTIFIMHYWYYLYDVGLSARAVKRCVKLTDVGKCVGPKYCCQPCYNVSGGHVIDSFSVIQLSAKVKWPPCVISAGIGVCLCGYVILSFISSRRVTLLQRKRADRNLRITSGLMIVAILVIVLSLLIYSAVCILYYIEFYIDCQTYMTLQLSWSWVLFLILLEFSGSVVPSLTYKMAAAKARHCALMGTPTGFPVTANECEIPCAIMRGLLRAVIDILGGVTLLWWPVVIVYFIGVGRGHWIIRLH